MNRRVFITGMAGILASGIAPSVLPSGVIMRIKPIVLPGDDDLFPFACDLPGGGVGKLFISHTRTMCVGDSLVLNGLEYLVIAGGRDGPALIISKARLP